MTKREKLEMYEAMCERNEWRIKQFFSTEPIYKRTDIRYVTKMKLKHFFRDFWKMAVNAVWLAMVSVGTMAVFIGVMTFMMMIGG